MSGTVVTSPPSAGPSSEAKRSSFHVARPIELVYFVPRPVPSSRKMSYPAYIPKTPAGAPELVEIDGNVCVCLYTNRKALERFYIDKYSPTAAFLSVPAWSFISAAELVTFLTKSKRQFVQQECRFVAVNVQPGVQPMYATIAAFVEELNAGG